MLGLGAYRSSSEDEGEVETPLPTSKLQPKEQPVKESQATGVSERRLPEREGPIQATPANLPVGPVLGPSHPQGIQPDLDMRPPDGHSSPFPTSLALVHDLTLPPIPNLDIPPSPPGSPDPTANVKFAHFLSLKKQGTHFNEKLAGSSSLKNPSLVKKMMGHSGIDGQVQYSTSLPLDLWDMSSLPKWGFKEELLRTQQEIRLTTDQKRLTGQRDSIEFAPGTTGTSGTSNLPSSRAAANAAGRSSEA